jgi:hypothetical protein
MGVYAQDRRISGQIIDGNTNEPLPWANALVKRAQTGVVTDADGRFTLNVAPGRNKLAVSAIGFIGQDVMIGNQTSLTIVLCPDVKTL